MQRNLDDVKVAVLGEPCGLVVGLDPVMLVWVADKPGPDVLSWRRDVPADPASLAGVVVVPTGTPHVSGATLIRTDHPRLVFARIARRLFLQPVCPVSSGIGGTGFGFVRNVDGELERFPHYGQVLLGQNVEIGQYACIDRGALTDTVLEDGVKIDNLCHIAHGAHIGAHTSIAALTCIEGSVRIGKRCTIGSNVTFQIGSGCGDEVIVGSGSVVTKWIPDGEVWAGNPAKFLRTV